MREYKFTKEFTEFVLKKYDYDMKEAALDIGCHYETIRRNAKKFGIEVPHRYKKNKQPNRKSRSKFDAWVQANKAAWKHLSYKDLMEQSGCSYKTIWNYMDYKRRKANKLVDQDPWFDPDKPVTLESFDGVRVPDSAFEKVKVFVHNRTGEIKLHVTLHTGKTYDFLYDVDELARLYQ